MSQIQIQTTQNVALSFTPASVGDRILSHFIDWVIFIAWFLIFALVYSGMGSSLSNGKIGMVVFFVFMLLPIMLYDLLFEAFMNGQTLGKRAMNIRVLALDGTPPTLGAYIMRWMFRLVDTGIFGSMVALIVVAVNGKGQRLGDIAAGTVVVKLKQAVSLEQLKQEKIQEDYVPMFPEASLLSDRDVVTIRAVLKKGRDENNNLLVWEAAQKVKEVIGIQSDMDNMAFLQQVLQDHTYLMTVE
jgi:uncharacterized RDD family membrane protein YckC